MDVVNPILLIGPPGSGKTTHGRFLAKKLHVPFVSAGELLRKEVAEGTSVGKLVDPVMAKGGLVPSPIVRNVVGKRLRSEDAKKGFILDGFPRTLEEARHLDRVLLAMGWKKVIVFELRVPEAEIKKRLSRRGRKDDVPLVVKQRLRVYNEETLPVLAYYRAKHYLTSIDGTGKLSEVQSRLVYAAKACKSSLEKAS